MSRPLRAWLFRLLIAAAVVLNPWTLGLVLAADGRIDKGLYVLAILLCELLLLVLGLFVLRRSNLLRYALGGAAAASLLVAVYGLTDFLQRTEAQRRTAPDSDQKILARVLGLDRYGFASRDLETAEILYSLHREEHVLPFVVPPQGVLDTATGIDPWIAVMSQGEVAFEIGVTAADGSSGDLFKKVYDLSASNADLFRWQDLSIDLSGYAGQEVLLTFKKSHSGAARRAVYDLTPTDLAYWRRPRVRPAALPGKKNVVLISLDTLRADHLGYMGYERATSSAIDRLAREGVAFSHCISQAPWTTPAHFSIFTSTYPSVHRGDRSAQEYAAASQSPETSRWWNHGLPTLASILSDAGYATGAFTGNGMVAARFGFLKGFDFYNHSALVEGSDVEQVVDKTLSWLSENRGRSFLLFVHTFEPHVPFVDDYFVKREKIADADGMEQMIARYDGDVRKADAHLGRLIDFLREESLLEETIVVVTSDHGEEFTESAARGGERLAGHGHSLYDELLRVPLVLYGLDQASGGRTVDAQVRSIDILPTVLDYLELPLADTFQGESLRDVLTGGQPGPRPALSEATTYGTARESLRADGFKYIHRLSYGQLTHPKCRDFALTPLHELYDLRSDPSETQDLAALLPEKLEEMQELLLAIFPERDFSAAGWEATFGSEDGPRLRDDLKALGYLE